MYHSKDIYVKSQETFNTFTVYKTIKTARSQRHSRSLNDKFYLLFRTLCRAGLFQTVNIKLETPKRKNQKDYKPQPYIFRKSRKRIETLFSQLCDQFRIRSNYAKSFNGFKTRILAKITAMTLIQYINKFIFDRPINNIKNQTI